MSAPLYSSMSTPGAAAAPSARRRWVLMLGLGLTLAATAWVASHEEPNVEVALPAAAAGPAARPLPPAVSADTSAASSASSPSVRLGRWPAALQPPAAQGWPDAEAQVLQSWGLSAAQPAPPPALAAKRSPPPPPEPDANAEPPAAPPLGYQWVGRMDEAQRPRLVLSNNLRTVVLAVGETLDQQWRLDAIGPNGAQFTWLPGGQKLSLAYP